MACPNLPLGLVNSPLVMGIYNVYSPNEHPSNQNELLTETGLPIFTETMQNILIS